MSKEREDKTLATQIAATPTIKGKQAIVIYKEANKKPPVRASEGIQKLADIFEKMMK